MELQNWFIASISKRQQWSSDPARPTSLSGYLRLDQVSTECRAKSQNKISQISILAILGQQIRPESNQICFIAS
jgi:hypothetical protein